MLNRNRRIGATLTLVAALSLIAVGCANSPPASPPPSDDPGSIQYELPKSVVDSGVLRVGSQQTFAPVEFKEPGDEEVKGYSADLLREIANRLGVELQWVTVDFSALFSGVTANRFDIASGGHGISKERLDALYQVGYIKSTNVLLSLTENAEEYKDSTLADLCGKTVAVVQGSTNISTPVEKASAEECVAKGNEPIVLQQFPSIATGTQQLDLGRIDLYIPSGDQAAYMITQTGDKYSVVGPPGYSVYTTAHAWAFQKNDDGKLINDAVATVLTELIEDGTYTEIITKWNMQDAAVDEPIDNVMPSF